MLFLFLSAAVVALVAAVGVSVAGLTKIDEGFAGVSFFGGAVLDSLAEPGYHVHVPFIFGLEVFPISIQTTLIQNVPCGTSSGIVIDYERVEVVYQVDKRQLIETVRNYSSHYEDLWIHDQVRHTINEICSVNTLQEIYIEKFSMLDELLVESLRATHAIWAPGLNVISARTTKPTIPYSIRRNYEAIEEQRTELLIKDQAQKSVLKKAETEGRALINKAEKEASIATMTKVHHLGFDC